MSENPPLAFPTVRRIWTRTGPVVLALVTLGGVLVWAWRNPPHLDPACLRCVGGIAWILRMSTGLVERLLALALIEVVVVAVLFLLGAVVLELAVGAASWLWGRTVASKLNELTLTDEELECAEQAFQGYDNPAVATSTGPAGSRALRYVERFWLEGGVFGFVDASREDKVFVVFRGTSELGNWFLTNAQAHMVSAAEVLGGTIPGGLHNGFVKAFEDLWLDKKFDGLVSGEEAKPYTSASNYELMRTKWLWAPLWAAVFGLPIWLFPTLRPADLQTWRPFTTYLAVTGVLLVVDRLLAYGNLVSGFHRFKKLVVGPSLKAALATALADVGNRQVIFTGHSLGGALATLAFVAYRTGPERANSAALVTFGAPRVGNDVFLTWLDERVIAKEFRISIKADHSDPVPHLPPSWVFTPQVGRRVTWLSAILAGLYWVGWVPYAIAYQAWFSKRWPAPASWTGDEGMTVKGHFVYETVMKEILLKMNRQRGRRVHRASRRSARFCRFPSNWQLTVETNSFRDGLALRGWRPGWRLRRRRVLRRAGGSRASR